MAIQDGGFTSPKNVPKNLNAGESEVMKCYTRRWDPHHHGTIRERSLFCNSRNVWPQTGAKGSSGQTIAPAMEAIREDRCTV